MTKSRKSKERIKRNKNGEKKVKERGKHIGEEGGLLV